MGLLKDDKVLKWEEMKIHIKNYKMKGILQFLELYKQFKNNKSIPYYWGYEMEYMFVICDKHAGSFKLNLIGSEMIEKLSDIVDADNLSCWKPEYANWMIEKIPEKPYTNKDLEFLNIENDIKDELTYLNKALDNNTFAIMLTAFPLLGTKQFFLPNKKTFNQHSLSSFLPDNIINPHIRFKTLTENIRKRRGKKVKISIPIFKDINTQEEKILMDCMGFGMGCCCSQLTLQCSDMNHSMLLYDNFAILSPILLALSASCPILMGKLSNKNTRWSVIEQAVDDRRSGEKINKSRYSTISHYVHIRGQSYNDIDLELNTEYLSLLKKNGIPDNLAKHISHLFVRDPILMYEDDIKELHTEINDYDFFLNINSSNWNNVRLKPPLNSKDSWKVEIRVLDMQSTIFENSAFFIFIVLLAKAITFYEINFYISISLVDKNFIIADSINCLDTNYYFRRFWDNDKIELVSLYDIVKNLINLIKKYLLETNSDVNSKIDKYLDYIFDIVKNKENNASKTRDLVLNHSAYNNDSVINQEISNDIIINNIINLTQEIN
jgi:glutamate--cysteine ligase catalytic subunit